MAISLSTITGQAQTGFTNPGYVPTADSAPDLNMKQWAILSGSGTQAGVLYHTPANPFTISFAKPKVLKTLSGANPVTGVIASVPFNDFAFIGRKGLVPYTNGVPRVGVATLKISIPAGADITDPANVRALISALLGALVQNSAGLGDTLVTGIM